MKSTFSSTIINLYHIFPLRISRRNDNAGLGTLEAIPKAKMLQSQIILPKLRKVLQPSNV